MRETFDAFHTTTLAPSCSANNRRHLVSDTTPTIMNDMTSTIGFLAAVLTTVSFVPQVLKVWRARSATDISLGMYTLFTLGVALWLVYGVLIHSWPIIIAESCAHLVMP